jgi:hypothetical protein
MSLAFRLCQKGAPVQDLWNSFKKELFASLDKYIPSKLIRSDTSLPCRGQIFLEHLIDDLMSDGFDVSMMSRRLFHLVVVSCI